MIDREKGSCCNTTQGKRRIKCRRGASHPLGKGKRSADRPAPSQKSFFRANTGACSTDHLTARTHKQHVVNRGYWWARAHASTASMASTGGRGGIPPHSPNLPNSPSSSARAIEALAEAVAGGGWRRQLSPPPLVLSCGQAQKASSPPASASSHPLAVAWPPRLGGSDRAWRARQPCTRRGRRLCAWHWH